MQHALVALVLTLCLLGLLKQLAALRIPALVSTAMLLTARKLRVGMYCFILLLGVLHLTGFYLPDVVLWWALLMLVLSDILFIFEKVTPK